MTPEGDNPPADQIRDLQERLAEAEETLRALRSGEVDAVVASGPDGDRVYTLKGADEAYRVMVQNMADGALTVTQKGLILFANQQFASMLGMPLERVIGSSIHDFIVDEDAAMLDAVLARSTARTAEVQFRKGSNGAVPAQLSAVGLVLEGGECICVNVTDLTEQKRNQQIVAAERLARSILDQAAGAILVLDGSGTIVRASQAAEQMANGIVLLRHFDEVFFLYDNCAGKNYGLAEILSALVGHGTVTGMEATVRRADGQTCEVLLSASRLTGPESEFLGCTIVLSDVSAIREAEAAVRESELRLRTLGDNLPEGAIYRHSQAVDGTLRFEFVSAGIERLTGVTAAEIMSDATAFERTVIPEDAERLRTALALSSERLTRFEIEIRHTHRGTGEQRWSLLRSVPSRRADGSTMWDGIQLDITERKNSEAVIQHKQKLESVGLLAGGIAHDFNNILTVIMGNASAALEHDSSDSAYARSILSAAERAANLTRQLLAYAGKGNIILRRISLTEHVSAARELLRASVPKRVRLEFDLSPGVPWLQADGSQLEQILLNLVINAGESIPPHSDGSIRIATRGVEFTPEMVRAEPTLHDPVEAGMYVCLEVSDNGAGIDQATLSRIFDPFFTTKFTGRGLGLAAVQGIVRASRGFIRVQSRPGEGATFQVFLPAAVGAIDNEVSKTAVASTASLQRSATILVVDDEVTIRTFARRALERYGYTVLEAENGRVALDIISGQSRPDLVLLDFAMPVMGGDELLSILGARFPGLRVICSSGYPQEEILRSPGPSQVVGYLQKPYAVLALTEKVRQALEDRS